MANLEKILRVRPPIIFWGPLVEIVPSLNPSLVGREQELELLLGYLGEAILGHGGLVIVSGEAGIGKTRLMEEFVNLSARTGCLVVIGRCVPGAPAPLMPFEEATSRLSCEESRGSLKPQSSETSPQSKLDMSMLHILERIRVASTHQPVLLIIEDMHWADSSSVKMLIFLSRNLGDMGVMAVMTYRPEDLQPDQEGHEHPLIACLGDLRTAQGCHELGLMPLTPTQVQMLMESMLDGDVEEGLAQRITIEGEGNPLYSVETVNYLLRNRSIARTDGVWKASEDLQVIFPQSLREAILLRIRDVSLEEKRVLESASIIGERFHPDLLFRLLDMSESGLRGHLEALEKAHGLIINGKEECRFCHETIRRAVYESLPKARRRELHLRIGHLMEQTGAARGELSTHFFLAGESQRCARYSMDAGRECLNGFASKESLVYFQRALRCLGDGFSPERLDALEGLADAYKNLSHHDQAIDLYSSLRNQLKDDQVKIRVLRKEAECWLPHGRADPEMVLRLVSEAEGLGPVPFLEGVRLRMVKANVLNFLGLFDEGRRLLLDAEGQLEGTSHKEELGLCQHELAFVYLSIGRILEAEEASERSRYIFSSIGSPSNELSSLFYIGIVQMHRGERERVIEAFDSAIDIARRFGNTQQLFFVRLYKAFFMLYQSGEGEMALKESLMAMELARNVQSKYIMLVANAVLAQAYLYTGALDKAEASVNEAMALVPNIPPNIKSPIKCSFQEVWAEMLMAKGNWSAGESVMLEAIDSVKGIAFGGLWLAQISGRYGQLLAAHNQGERAIMELKEAVHLYGEMGNTAMMKKLEVVIASIKGVIKKN